MRSSLLKIAVAALIAAAAYGVGVATPHGVPACLTEDSTNCHWDAETAGNGAGRSFVDVDGVAYYAPVTLACDSVEALADDFAGVCVGAGVR